MIYCLTGKVVKKTLDTVVISCAGVGYLAQVPTTTAGSLPRPRGGGHPLHRHERHRERRLPLRLFVGGTAVLLQAAHLGYRRGAQGGARRIVGHDPRKSRPGGLLRRPQGLHQGVGRGAQAGPAHCPGTEGQGGQGPGHGHRLCRRRGGNSRHRVGPAPRRWRRWWLSGTTPSDAARAVSRVDDTLPVQDIIKIALRGLSKL